MQLLLETLTYHRDSAGPLSVVVILLVRVTLVLLTTLLFGRLLARASAAVQHRVWLLGLLGTLAVPVLWAATPGWRMSLLVLKVNDTPASSVEMPIAASASPWLMAMVTLWLTGMLLGLIYLIVGIVSARRTFRNSLPCDDPLWLGALGEARRDIGMHGPMQLRTTSHLAAPAVWSLWRIRILVPESTTAWTLAQRRSVLVHELTHARRRDCWSQLLASIVCAVWWFHPLAWLASARLRLLAEQAADDGVLRSGTGRTDYASHLLAIAASLGRLRFIDPALLRVAGSHLEQRIRAILDPSRMRYPLRVHHARLSWLIGCTLLVALATCSPTDVQPVTQQADSRPKIPGRIDLRFRLHAVPVPTAEERKPVVASDSLSDPPISSARPTSTGDVVFAEPVAFQERILLLSPGSVAGSGSTVEIPAPPASPFQLIPNWEAGRDAAMLLPNFVPGTAKVALVSPLPDRAPLSTSTEAATVATATAEKLSVRY
jgi:beta-lactamase regulating signal transducer with metallopeptidase domain